jgi:hypothetical protein
MSNEKQIDPKSKFKSFSYQVNEVIETGDMFLLRNFLSRDEYFEMLKTDVLRTLSQQTRKKIEAGGDYPELQLLLNRILLRRYLLSERFSDFRQFTQASGIEIPSALEQLLENFNYKQEVYKSQMQLIKGLADLQCHDELFKSIRQDIRVRFYEHLPSVHVAATLEHSHPLIRPAITFMIASDNSKITTAHDLFMSAQKIDEQFRQTTEEIQDAMQLTNNDESRYWYRLDVLQNLVRNGAIWLDGRSAGAAIGWLIFSIEENIPWHTPLLSIWGVYDAYHRQFRPVDALQEKLDACVEDGIRIVAVPQATLEQPIGPETSFKDYAKQQKVHLISFPDNIPIFQVYSCLLENYQKLDIEFITKDKIPDVGHTGTNQKGELLVDQTGKFYWLQTKKFYSIQNIDVIEHMRSHKMPGWSICRKVNLGSRIISGPPFYFTDKKSSGLLIKFYWNPDTFLVDNAQKHKFSDEYSFENYRYQGALLEWGDIISVTEDILQQFPTGSPIQIRPNLSSPLNGVTLNESTVTLCCKPHPNRIWEYHFQITDNQDFSALVYEDVIPSPSLVINNLMPGKYWWRMQGFERGRQPSAWSETWSFTIVPPSDER